MAHRDHAHLEAAVEDVRGSPRDAGTVELICARPAIGARELLDTAELDSRLASSAITGPRRGASARRTAPRIPSSN
jgi:hypothetical protein